MSSEIAERWAKAMLTPSMATSLILQRRWLIPSRQSTAIGPACGRMIWLVTMTPSGSVREETAELLPLGWAHDAHGCGL